MSYHDDGEGQLVPAATFRQTYVPPPLPAATPSPAQTAPAAGGFHWMPYAAGGVALVGIGVGAFFVIRKMRRKAGSVATKNRH